MKNNLILAKEWLKKAADDEKNAQSLLKHRDGTPNGICFLSHQMSEKNLKSFLICKSGEFPKTHALDALLELCLEYDNDHFLTLKQDVLYLNPFYIGTRYPGDYPEFDWQDAEQAFASAMNIKEVVESNIKKSHKKENNRKKMV